MIDEKNAMTDEIIIPPGCESALLKKSGEKIRTFTPSSYRPYMAEVPPHGMRGRTDSISVVPNNNSTARRSLFDYLKQFQGATLCLDLWAFDKQRIKRCGTLLEVGDDFLVIGESVSGKLSIIDLKPIRYINLYCR